jgi:hypothetical protein
LLAQGLQRNVVARRNFNELQHWSLAMRALAFVSFLFAAVSCGSAAHAAAGPVVTYATMNNGTLVVKGTAAANQTVTLDNTHTVTSTGSGTFAFSIAGYSPTDCVVLIAVGTGRATGAVDNCRRGVNVTGHVSLSGIPNGRCSQVTFGVSGARPGDTALVSIEAAIQNGILLYAQQVVSAGHVMVNACNFSGVAMTAISNFPVRIMTFR